MAEKRFTVEKNDKWICILDNGETIGNTYHIAGLLNALHEENRKLKSENNMLRITIGRNEAFIDRLTHQSKLSNCSNCDVEWLRNNTVWEQMPSNYRTYTAIYHRRNDE